MYECSLFILIAEKPRTCQDFACCYKNITNSNCDGAPLVNESGMEIHRNGIDCTNKEESCRKYIGISLTYSSSYTNLICS